MSGLLAVMVASAGVGVGAFVVVRGLRPRPVPLAAVAVALRQPGRAISVVGVVDDGRTEGLSGWQRWLGVRGLGLLEALGVADRGGVTARLRILDRSPERHAYEKVLAGCAGLMLPTVLMVLLAATGSSVSPGLGLSLGVVLAVGGFFYPDLPLRQQVERRQRAFRHALSSYLDLVTIILAGGGGIETALHGAADAGDGWAFAEIRTALRRAELTGRSPWELFDELGQTLGVDELRDLAASISMAGGHGAKIRQSLSARADALRAHQSAEIEQLAEAQSERMIVPVTVMLVGLTLFIGFGAVDAISTDGGAAVRADTTGQVGP